MPYQLALNALELVNFNNNINPKEAALFWHLKHSKAKFILFTLAFVSSTIMPFMSLRSNWFFKEPSSGPFKQIETYREVQKIFDACDKKTLVTFDVDDTLITAADVMANFDFPLWFGIRALLKYPGLLLSKSSIEPVLGLIFQQAQRFVFDPDIVNIIKQIRRQGCTVVALTSMWSGPYGCIENMPKWRADMLSNFGINFEGQISDVSLTAIPKYRNQNPCLYKGIIFANRTDKGKVLEAFLDHLAKDPNHFKPTQIISFDDQEDDLNSIASACAKKKIAFAGYQMLGGKKLCGQWSTSRALLQLDFLKHDNLWLTDKEADAILAGEIENSKIENA